MSLFLWFDLFSELRTNYLYRNFFRFWLSDSKRTFQNQLNFTRGVGELLSKQNKSLNSKQNWIIDVYCLLLRISANQSFFLDFDYVLKLRNALLKYSLAIMKKSWKWFYFVCVFNIKKCIAEIFTNVIKKVFQAINYWVYSVAGKFCKFMDSWTFLHWRIKTGHIK